MWKSASTNIIGRFQRMPTFLLLRVWLREPRLAIVALEPSLFRVPSRARCHLYRTLIKVSKKLLRIDVKPRANCVSAHANRGHDILSDLFVFLRIVVCKLAPDSADFVRPAEQMGLDEKSRGLQIGLFHRSREVQCPDSFYLPQWAVVAHIFHLFVQYVLWTGIFILWPDPLEFLPEKVLINEIVDILLRAGAVDPAVDRLVEPHQLEHLIDKGPDSPKPIPPPKS